MSDDIRRRALRRAIDIAGGAAALCTYLDVAHSTLSKWLSGEEAVPEPAFLRLVDVLLGDLAGAEKRALEAARRVAHAARSRSLPNVAQAL